MLGRKDARIFTIIALVAVAVFAGILGGILFYAKCIEKDQESSNVVLTPSDEVVNIDEMSDEELFNAIQSEELRIDQIPEERVEAAYEWDRENAGGIQHPELDAVYDILVGYQYDVYMNNVKVITGKTPKDIVVDTNETNDYYIVTWRAGNYLGTFCGSDDNTYGTILKQVGEYEYETVLDWKPNSDQ